MSGLALKTAERATCRLQLLLGPVAVMSPGLRVTIKNASQKDWHFAGGMYTMKQKSYAAVSASTGTITLAWLPFGPW